MLKRRFALLSALGLLFFACKQSPIFYEISREVEPLDPRIAGSPTNIVQRGNTLYVASRFGRTVYQYEGSEWSVLTEAPEKIIELAITDNVLYALTGTPGSLRLQQFSLSSSALPSASWGYSSASWGYSSASWGYSSASWGHSSASWGHSSASWGDSSASSGHSSASSGHSSASSGHSSASSGYSSASSGLTSVALRSTSDSTWSSIDTKGYNVQSIYGAGEYLFAGSMDNSSSCSILYVKEGESKLTRLKLDTSLLKGAVYDETTYYLATNGNGILTTTDPSSSTLQDGSKYKIVGIIKVGDKIVGVSRDGYILYGNASNGFTAHPSGVTYTGALATWKNPNDTTQNLLLLGIQGGGVSTVHGYREILLKDDGTLNPDNMSLSRPGENEPSSVRDYEQYVVDIGKQPLSSIIQAPGGILFAATAKDGLWSYRERNGKFVWNAED